MEVLSTSLLSVCRVAASGLPVPSVRKGLPDHKDLRDPKVLPARKAQLVRKARPVQRAQQALQARKARPVQLAQQGQRAQLVPKGRRESA
jgi:hypothetical protein